MTSPQPNSQPAVVDRLRAAGCVFAEAEAELLVAAAPGCAELMSLVDRRVAGEPLEYILGRAEFCDLRIAIDPGVFVPRRRTELVVREAVARARAGAVVVDLCCGSGAVGLAVATRVPGVELYAADIDPTAVRCAERNLARIGGRVFYGDLYDPLPRDLQGNVDVLVVNAPYVPTESIALMPPEARDHEPRVALDGGADGLDVHRRVAADAHRWLMPGACLVIETSETQSQWTAEAANQSGLQTQIVRSTGLGATAVVAARPR